MTTTAAPLTTIQIGKDWFPERPGGLDRYYYDLIRHLPNSGVEVNGFVIGSMHVATDSAGTVQSFAAKDANLMTRWRGVRQQVRQALKRNPDSLVVSHFALYAAPCLDLLGAAPFVVHFQGPWSAESRAEGASAFMTHLKGRLEQSVYGRASRLIVLSRAFRDVLQETHNISPDRVAVIPGGVDCPRWRPKTDKAAARAELGWPPDRPIVFAVRRLVRRMGLERLIESVQHLRARVPDVLLLIAGKGALSKELDRRIVTAGLSRNVQLAGFVPDEQLAVAYRAADLTVVPSVALEGFGLVAVESLAAGTPVLVTNVGGLPETIERLAPQCIFESGDAACIGNTIADALLGRLPLPDAERCIEFATSSYDWSSLAPRIAGAYRETIQ